MSIDLITRFNLKPATLQSTAPNLCWLITLHACVSLSNWGVHGHLEIDRSMPCTVTTFFDGINRGGLTRPSEYTFLTAVQCWRIFSMIKSSATLTSQFLSATEHRSLFSAVVDRAVGIDQAPLVEDYYCFNNHDIKAMIVKRLFNCLFNYCSRTKLQCHSATWAEFKKKKYSEVEQRYYSINVKKRSL